MSAALDLDHTLAALAEPTRRGVVELLRQGPRRAGDLAAAFDMSPPAMSRHLRVLRTSGLVDEQRDEHDSRVRLYRLRPEPLSELRAWLETLEAFWVEQLGTFAQHVERRTRRDKPSKRRR